MFGRYVTLMNQLVAKLIYEKPFVRVHPEVSIEYDACSTYIGLDRAKVCVDSFAAKLSGLRTKRGWLCFRDDATSQVVFSENRYSVDCSYFIIRNNPQFLIQKELHNGVPFCI